MKTGTLLVLGGVGVPAGLAAWLVVGASPGAPTGAALAELGPQEADGIEWYWALNGPVSADAGVDLSVDPQGNVFLAGGHGGLDMDRDGTSTSRRGPPLTWVPRTPCS